MISISVAWGLSAIITAAGGFDKGSFARTDRRLNVLTEADWIRFPYPGIVVYYFIVSYITVRANARDKRNYRPVKI